MDDALLRNEYKEQNQKIQYCIIDGKQIIIPISYQGNKDKFIDDIFEYEKEAEKYRKHNQQAQSAQDIIDIKMLTQGNISFLPPYNLVMNKLPTEEIIKKASKHALRKYRAAIKKTARHNKEYPEEQRLTTMAPEAISEIERKHQRYCAKSVLTKFGKFAGFSAKQIAQMSAGVIGILPVVAYNLIDKKVKFQNNKAKTIIDKKIIPYICKGALKSLIPLSMYGAFTKHSSSEKAEKNIADITIITTPETRETSPIIQETSAENIINASENNNQQLTRTHKIKDLQSFQKLYNDALDFIGLSMFPTEILVNHAYTDNGKTINTIGLGSFWYPQDGNPTNKKWILTSEYVKNKNNITISGKKALELMDGWYRHRENGRIYKDMYLRLKGCELKTHEFAAIATVMYNNEVNGKELCNFVKKNYKNPKKCAAKIMELKPQNERFTDGILKRHTHEALIYLNCNNYIEKIPYFIIKKDKNSKGKTFYVTSITQLTPQECYPMLEGLKKGNETIAQNLVKKIENYRCKNGETIYALANKNGLKHICHTSNNTANFYEISRLQLSEKLYQTALKHYNQKKYQQALTAFTKLEAEGFNGADIHNDKAITYYNIGEYEKCIQECREVLKSGETEAYPAANFNAGKAYEKLNAPDKALQNYQLALKRSPDETAYQNAVERLQKNPKLAQLNIKKDKSSER